MFRLLEINQALCRGRRARAEAVGLHHRGDLRPKQRRQFPRTAGRLDVKPDLVLVEIGPHRAGGDAVGTLQAQLLHVELAATQFQVAICPVQPDPAVTATLRAQHGVVGEVVGIDEIPDHARRDMRGILEPGRLDNLADVRRHQWQQRGRVQRAVEGIRKIAAFQVDQTAAG